MELAGTLVPGALVVYLGFNAGGFFAGTTGVATAVMAVLLAFRILISKDPVAGLSATGVVALSAMAAYAGWSLLSGVRSHAPARAVIEFDRALLYLLVVGLAATTTRGPNRPRMLIRGIAVGLAVVCGAGFLSRTLPRVFPIHAAFENQRLSYPVTYWNALGMLAVLGLVCCVHIASDANERRLVRAVASGLVPAFAATLLLTFSRGSIAGLLAGLAIYAVLAPSLRLLGTAVATVPAAALAVFVTYHAGRLAALDPTTPGAVAQGHRVAAVVGGCVVASAVIRAVLLVAEHRVVPVRVRRAGPRSAAIVIALTIIVGGVALGLTGWIGMEYHDFATGRVASTGPVRDRLTSAASNGRIDLWRVALKGFRSSPVDGTGAGTYALMWARDRPVAAPAQDAHSLYLETLDELGLAGLIVLLAFLATLLFGSARLVRDPGDRGVGAIAVAALATVALHASVDWDWEMPVVMVPALALAAAAGARTEARGAYQLRPSVRLGVFLCALATAATPVLVAVSQMDLNASVRAFDAGDCRAAISQAHAASAVVGIRPEPFEIIGYCDAYHGATKLAVRAMRRAVSRDPNDWEFHFGLAIATASAGQDPRPQLRVAARLDPLEPLIAQAVSAFSNGGRRVWRRDAAGLPIDVG